MYAVIFVLVFIVHSSQAFTCPGAIGTYANPDDYRSYYSCLDRCFTVEYCTTPTIYFTRLAQKCVIEPPDWQPRFNLTDQFKSSENADAVVEQRGYNVNIFHETASRRYDIHTRYINQTHAIGIQTIHQLLNNCVVVFNIRLVATDTRTYCHYETFHPYSSKCDLPENYSGNYCKTY